MSALTIILYAVGILLFLYVLVWFVFSRLFVNYLGFREQEMPKRIPRSMLRVIRKLELKSRNQKEYLNNVWRYVTAKYRGITRGWFRWPQTLLWNLHEMWKARGYLPGYLPCSHFAYLTKIFLLKSKFFKKDDVKEVTYFTRFNVHRCLKVKLKNAWLYVDPFARHEGIGLGGRKPYF